MNELLIFREAESCDKVGIYYNTWLFIIKCIIMKYAHKSSDEADEILKKTYYKKPNNYYDVICMSHETEYHWGQCSELMENNIGLKESVLSHLLIMMNGMLIV